MTDAYISAPTLDDVIRHVIDDIQSHGERIKPSKGWATELTGVLVELTDPRARLSRTETRGKPYSCLGELCWYLAKTNKLDFISYYIPRYKDYADADEVFGGYGPRLFNWKGLTQLDEVTDVLRRKTDSRQAVIQLFDGHDIIGEHGDVPCTCTLQFMLRGKGRVAKLYGSSSTSTAMRSYCHDDRPKITQCFSLRHTLEASSVPESRKHACDFLSIPINSRYQLQPAATFSSRPSVSGYRRTSRTSAAAS